MRALAFILSVSLAITAHPNVGARPDRVAAFVLQRLGVSSYKRADIDLNGDRHNEILVYATDSCGSGGCDLTVLSPQGNGYRVVMKASGPAQLPIMLLSTSTRGRRDIGVTVVGGGIRRAYMARLRFDGHRYPDNVTVPPAIPPKRPSGRVLIPR